MGQSQWPVGKHKGPTSFFEDGAAEVAELTWDQTEAGYRCRPHSSASPSLSCFPLTAPEGQRGEILATPTYDSLAY